MSGTHRASKRVVIATVTAARGATVEDAAKGAAHDLHAAGFAVVRSVFVKPEPDVIGQLVANVSNDNEAEALILIGGAGIGPRDSTCDTLDAIVERHIEGFGEGYRRWLREELSAGPSAL
ncbi:MAG: molybdopterin-binding protein, partial [Polyangiaceae bacterium]